MTNTVRSTDLTRNAFAPFGTVVSERQRQPDADSNALAYWHDIFHGALGDDLTVSYFMLKERPFLMSEMECHPDREELFVALRGECLMPFAPSLAAGGDTSSGSGAPTAAPDLGRLAAFRIRPGDAFLINAGSWHCAAFPTNGDAMCFALVLPCIALEAEFVRLQEVGPVEVVV